MRWSPEIEVLFLPAATYRRLAEAPPAGNWLARPALVALVLGCGVSLMTAGRLTLRLALPAALLWSFVPLLEIASLAIVCRGSLPIRRAVGLFFVGHAPWSLWMVASAAVWGLLPTAAVYPHVLLWKATAAAVLAWSAYIDYGFFREICGGRALARLLAQRALCWIPGSLLFVAPAGWQTIASALGI